MLRYMERSTIHFLKQKGWTNVQIAEFTGHHRDTIAKVLKEAVDKKPKTRQRSSAVDVFRPQIASWLDQNLPVIRMLEMAREDHDHPYSGSETAFYDYVRKMRRARQQTPRNVALRFEGVPGEYEARSIGAKCATSRSAKWAGYPVRFYETLEIRPGTTYRDST